VNRTMLIGLMLTAATQLSGAQIVSPATDVLGAHLNYGRGCTACHSPHSGSYGNGDAHASDPTTGQVALWGEDSSGLYGKVLTTDGGKYVETLPVSMSGGTPDVDGMLTCLSCHDGNYASNAMMKNKLYETLPSTYGSAPVPTLLGTRGGMAGNYLSDHPMGLSAAVSCGGQSGWDCSESGGVIQMNGPNASRFVSNYGFFVKPASYNNTAVVVCTTCHDPHTMSVVTINPGSNSGLPPGNYATMFFLRGPYNPNDTNPMSNQTAQFCRQCHADKSNEMNGSTARTVF
jgi:formate-dependent nitrite reductase cytochrome c552 subunit